LWGVDLAAGCGCVETCCMRVCACVAAVIFFSRSTTVSTESGHRAKPGPVCRGKNVKYAYAV
jgi:hypothetical protein